MAVAAGFALMLEKRFSRRLGLVFYRFIPDRFKERAKLNYREFNDGIKKLLGFQLVLPILLTIIAYSMFFLQCFIAARALGIDISLLHVALFVATSNLITLIPISVLGLGTRELTLIFLFSMVGQDPLGFMSRFTFDIFAVKAGIPLLPMLIGVFAIPDILMAVEKETVSYISEKINLSKDGGRLKFIEPRATY